MNLSRKNIFKALVLLLILTAVALAPLSALAAHTDIDLPVVHRYGLSCPFHQMFNAGLNEWRISADALPENSIIEHKDEDVWSLYGGYILIGVSVLIAETALLFGLLYNYKKRLKAESDLRDLNNSLEELVDTRTKELQIAKARLEELNKQLDYSSRIDVLTGLYNRRHMEERLGEEHQVFLRTGREFSVMSADIDDFKLVNDTYGHDAGDAVLKNLSKLFLSMVREYDVVARWGGEEFLLLFPGMKKEDAFERAQAIKREVESVSGLYNGVNLHATVTLGVATISGGESIDELLKKADNALYKGKSMGKNTVVISI